MTDDQLSRLERLTQLYKDGSLSEAEFNRQKEAIINPVIPRPAQPTAVNTPTPQPTPVKSVPAPPRKTSWGRWAIGIFLGLVFLNIVRSCNETPLSTTASTTMATDSASASSAIDEPAKPTAPVSKWSYYDNADKMGSKYYVASIEANDLLNFKFPYNGGSTATLSIRRKGGTTDLYLQVSKGQFITKYDGGSVRIKFDSGSPHTYSTTGAADYSSDILFIDGARGLIAKMKKSKKMIIEAEFYNEGSPQMEFDISGLKWTH